MKLLYTFLYALLLCASGAPAFSGTDTVNGMLTSRTVSTEHFQVTFTPHGTLHSLSTSFRPIKNRDPLTRTFRSSSPAPFLDIFTNGTRPVFNACSVTRSDSSTVCIFSNDSQSVTWHFPENRYVFSVSFHNITHPEEITLHPSTHHTTHSDQFSPVLIRKHSVLSHSAKKETLQKVRWFGTRNHFWTFLVRPPASLSSFTSDTATISGTIGSAGTDASAITFYAGPVEYFSLGQAGHECTHLLYPIWFWMRWLSIGLLHLFTLFLSTTGNGVLAIVLLSLSVKLILAPLYRIASRWQREVNQQKSILEPRLSEINRTLKGEDHNNAVLALHKELGISPLYALKSLLSAAIQIPIFFAAYHMLSEHIALSGVSFLWIGDLSRPDHFIHLPFSIPWFGSYLNILPLIMTTITIVTSRIHSDLSLSEVLHKKQQRSLFVMAGLFFLVLYTSPAGMLLYWTMNNLFSLFEASFTAYKNAKRNTSHH